MSKYNETSLFWKIMACVQNLNTFYPFISYKITRLLIFVYKMAIAVSGIPQMAAHADNQDTYRIIQ